LIKQLQRILAISMTCSATTLRQRRTARRAARSRNQACHFLARAAENSPLSINKRVYKARWLIENAFNRLKDFARMAKSSPFGGGRKRVVICVSADLPPSASARIPYAAFPIRLAVLSGRSGSVAPVGRARDMLVAAENRSRSHPGGPSAGSPGT